MIRHPLVNEVLQPPNDRKSIHQQGKPRPEGSRQCGVDRTSADILPTGEQHDTPRPAPKADDKWLTASVVTDAATVIASVFDEAERRDPNHQHTWIASVDGNTHQIDRIHAEADARGITVTTVVDFIHVLEYLWKAAWCFFPEADPAA